MTNKEYIWRRNSLIPKAKVYADKEAGGSALRALEKPGRKRWGYEWNKLFHASKIA